MTRIAFIFALAAAAAACRSPEQTPRAAEPAVVDAALVQARTAAMSRSFEAGGVVKARLTAPITSRVMAPAVRVLVRPGDRVQAGQTLILLDGRDLQAHADRAAASVTGAEQAVRVAQAEREAAAAALTLAKAAHGRIAGLHALKAATTQEFDEAVAALQGAEARAAGVEARVAEAMAGLSAANAGANAATITAAYAAITAPFAGTVTERAIDPGVMAAPGVPLLTLEDTTSTRLEVRLDADRASTVAVGQVVSVRCDDHLSDSWANGRVTEVSRIDPNGHSFLAKIDCPETGPAQSGRFGRARFPVGSAQALTVPSSALVRRGQLTFVFAVDGSGAARLRPVTAGASVDGRIEIAAGLADGERVVDTPSPSLVDGTRIKGAGAAGAPQPMGGGR